MSGPVEGLSAGITNDSSTDSFSVSISWSEPSEPNGVILQYNYTVSSTDTNTAIVSGSTGNTSVVESMLTVIEPFTNYTVGVVAINSAGEGEESTVTVESPQTGELTRPIPYTLTSSQISYGYLMLPTCIYVLSNVNATCNYIPSVLLATLTFAHQSIC